MIGLGAVQVGNTLGLVPLAFKQMGAYTAIRAGHSLLAVALNVLGAWLAGIAGVSVSVAIAGVLYSHADPGEQRAPWPPTRDSTGAHGLTNVIDVFAGTLATLGLCAACCALGLHAYRRTSELLSPWTLFLLMSVLDVFLPATLFLLGAPLGVAPWAQPLTPGTVTQATLVFTCAGSLFGAGYLLAARVVVAGSEPPVTTAFSGRRAYLVLAIAVALYAFYVGAGVVEAGSVGVHGIGWPGASGLFRCPAPGPCSCSSTSSVCRCCR